MQSKLIKYITIGAPLIIGGYLVMKYLKGNKGKNQSGDGDGDNGGGGGGGNSGGGTKNDKFPLQKGSKGAKVKELQKAIIAADKSLLSQFGADGDFGVKTEAAVFKILGKKIIENQVDIEKIVRIGDFKKNEIDEKKITTETRMKLANEIKNSFDLNKKLKFYVSRSGVYIYLISGKEYIKIVKSKNQEFFPSRTSTVISAEVNTDGDMQLKVESNKTKGVLTYIVNPYSITLK
jgi:hypothetical protein